MPMRRKRVCFVNPTVLLKRPIAELAESLHDYDVGLLIPNQMLSKRDLSLSYSDLPNNVEVRTYPTISLPLASEWPIPISPKFFFEVFRMFKKYDVIHMWTYFYISTFFIVLAKLFFPGKRLILTCDTFPSYSFDAGKMNPVFRIYNHLFGRILFSIPESITIYSEYLMKPAERIGRRKDIAVIPTGVHIRNFQGAPKHDIRREFSIPKNTTLILYVGLLVPRKGVDIIVETARNLKAENVRFVIVGDGPKGNEYKELVRKYGLSDKVVFTGWRKDIADFYKSADIFFFPSRGEGLPGAVMEAMAAGLPIVATNIPSALVLVADGKNGFLCEKDDVEGFTSKLGQTISNKSMRRNFSKNSSLIIAKYNWPQIMQHYKAMYDEQFRGV